MSEQLQQRRHWADWLKATIMSAAVLTATYQAGEGVVHAVLQSAPLQNGEQGGVVEATRSRGDQLLHPLTLRRIQTWTRHTEETVIKVLFRFRERLLQRVKQRSVTGTREREYHNITKHYNNTTCRSTSNLRPSNVTTSSCWKLFLTPDRSRFYSLHFTVCCLYSYLLILWFFLICYM